VTTLAPQGPLTHEVRLAFADGIWQARIVTLPRMIWVEPGGRRALVFTASTPEAAEQLAEDFIHRDCIARGYRVSSHAGGINNRSQIGLARRIIVPCPLRFSTKGLIQASSARARTGLTGNLSETGLFIATEDPLPASWRLKIDLRLPSSYEHLEGLVVWSRGESMTTQPRGMGVSLLSPPRSYKAGIQILGR